VPRTSEIVPCWSCGNPGQAIPGMSWTRECITCDVQWNAKPAPIRVP
jgi:hypothetical protein